VGDVGASKLTLVTVRSGCGDRSASGSAAEMLLFNVDGIGRKLHQPIFDLPESSKTLLIEFAMDVDSQRQRAQDLAGILCHDQIPPDSAD
jgi:hypothetical protein